MQKTTPADEKIAELERELRGAHEMLAHVLRSVGEPVLVSKAEIKEGLSQDLQIQIDLDAENDAFLFSLGVPRE